MLSNTALVILLWYEMTAGENLMMRIYVLAFLRLCGLGLVCILNVAAAYCACLLLSLFCGLVSSLQLIYTADCFLLFSLLFHLLSCFLVFSRSSVLALSCLTFLWYHIKRHSTNTALMILIWYHKADIIKIT